MSSNTNFNLKGEERLPLKKLLINILLSVFLIVAFSVIFDVAISKSSIELPPNLIGAVSIFFALCISSYYLWKNFPIKINLLGGENKNIYYFPLYGILGGMILLLINSPFRNSDDTIILKKFLVDPKEGYAKVVPFLMIVVILIPIVEEIFYRGFIFRLCRNSVNRFWSYFISSIIFSVGHSLSVSIFISGLILCYIYEKTSLILPCIIAHILWNMVWFSAKYFMVS